MKIFKMSLSANSRQGRLAQQLSPKPHQFASLFSEAPRFCLFILKVEGETEI
jgi:hypothetical protein